MASVQFPYEEKDESRLALPSQCAMVVVPTIVLGLVLIKTTPRARPKEKENMICFVAKKS